MQIQITLGGALVRHMPSGAGGNRFMHACDSSLSVADLLQQLCVPANQRLLVILNGNVIQPEAMAETALHDNDELSLMPPIAAG